MFEMIYLRFPACVRDSRVKNEVGNFLKGTRSRNAPHNQRKAMQIRVVETFSRAAPGVRYVCG